MVKSTRPTLNVATIEDVASLAGVSPSTASRVVSGKFPVREANRIKVIEAVRALNYVPNQAARSLASAVQERLGVIHRTASAAYPSAAYLSAFLLGAMDRCAEKGAELLMVRCEAGDTRAERLAVAKMLDSAVTGVLLPSPRHEASILHELLREANIPMVAVGAGGAPINVPTVRVDDRAAAFEMTRYLLDLGHRKIGFITGQLSQLSGQLRLAGFEAAMRATADAEICVAQGDYTFESGLTASERLIEAVDRPTAIFAANDDMAAAAVSVAQRRGLEVPRDLSVVGFDDLQIAVTLWPPLTTVRQPVGAMAAAAVDLLLREISQFRRGDQARCADQILPHVVVERQSATPPPPINLSIAWDRKHSA